jgi:hypothetical protein
MLGMPVAVRNGLVALFFPAAAVVLDWLAYQHHRIAERPFMLVLVMCMVFAALAGAALGAHPAGKRN